MIIKSKIIFGIRLFRYQFSLVRFPIIYEEIRTAGNGKKAKGAYLKQDGQYLIAVNENGQYIPAQIKLTLKDNINEMSTVVVEYPFAGIYNEEMEPKVDHVI